MIRPRNPRRPGRLRALLAALAGAAGVAGAAPVAAQEPPAPTFAQVIEQNFPAWDLNRDGHIEGAEIDRLMNATAIRGPAAAALATLKLKEHATPAAERARFAVTLEELVRPARQAGESEADPDEPRGPEHFTTNQAEYRRKLDTLAKLVPRLYAHERPEFAALHQGPAGDCYFFSVAGWLAARQPERIERMIEREPGGDFVVRFFDGEAFRVPTPTEAEMILYNAGSTLSDGYWIVVLEKALGERMREHNRNPHSSKRTAEAVDAMATGGVQGEVIHLFTGHRVHDIPLRDPRAERERLAELRRLLPETLREGRIAGVGMAKHPAEGHPKVPKLGYSHAYAILDYDPRTELVTVWNPWGDTFQPKGPEGPEHGYATEHGVFKVPLAQFYHVFSKVHLETAEREGEREHRRRR